MQNISFQTKSKLGRPFFILLALAPALFWIFAAPLNARFTDFVAILTSLGQLSGLVGLAAISLSIILAGRFKFLEDYFGGLDKVYAFHHFLTGLAFILILFHPLVLSVKYLLISTRSAALFLLPSSNWAQNFGIIAILGFIFFLSFSIFFEKIKYQWRKLSHKFLGFAFIVALAHSFFITSDISLYFPMRGYMLILSILGFAAFVWRGILGQWTVKKHNYRVSLVKIMSGHVTEVELGPMSDGFRFEPGQFVFITFFQKGIELEAHPFSLTSSPAEKKLKLAIKVLGDFTAKITNLKPGATAKIEGPFGRLSFGMQNDKEQIWIAGGIGITPFLGMARALNNPSLRVDLYYCAKNREEMAFLDEILQIEQKNKNFKVIPYCSDEQPERINTKIISDLSNGLTGKRIMLCGPPSLVQSFKKQLKDFKINSNLIRTEEFRLL